MKDESEILKRLRQNGEEELAQLFERMRGTIRGLIVAKLDRRLLPRVDASDIVQETYLRAVQGLSSFLEAPTLHPVVWIRLISKRLVAETHRRHFRGKRTVSAEIDFVAEDRSRLIDHLADSMLSVHTHMARKETVQRVQKLIETLSVRDREVLEMRHSEGMTLREIADVLQLNVETIKKRYQRALTRVASIYQD